LVDEFQAVSNQNSDIIIVEKRNKGVFLNIYVLKKGLSDSYTYDSKDTKAINLEFKAIDYTTVFILNKVVILYTAVETSKILFTVFDPAGAIAPFSGSFDVDPKNELVPWGIDCLKNKATANNQLICFVDTVGPANYDILYTIGQTEKAEGFITATALVEGGLYNSPKGFERIKTVQSYNQTAVLYQNNQVLPLKMSDNTPKRLLQGTPTS
jgi:hypothetical protein